MNRFLPRKKVRAEAAVEEITNSETQPLQPVPVPHNWSWGKKKTRIDPIPEPLHPTPVIPLSENFRTSLIMPNLSARFSMLREQDDPISPLGKAKDDSVLSPKRRSRLIDFGHVAGNLTDIVESSVSVDPIQTPPAMRRKTSFTYGQTPDMDDVFSAEPSMLNRPRPGENNNSFSGQTKTSRALSTSSGEAFPINSNEKVSPRKVGSPTRMGKDVEFSVIQDLREEHKRREVEQALTPVPCVPMQEVQDAAHAEGELQSSFAHDVRRDTTSSSISGPSMRSLSTAPTVYSPQLPSEPSPNLSHSQFVQKSKNALERSSSRKLYEQGLSQHMYDQQASAIIRANSTKLKASGVAGLSRAQSASNIRDRFERSDSVAKKSLPPLELDKLTTFESLRAPKTSGSSADKCMLQRPPLSPFDEATEHTNVLFEAINPSDRGKATAMAHFQRPKKFDEAQYLQRQMSLLQQQQRRKRRSVLSPAKKPTFPGKTGSPMKTTRPRLWVETKRSHDSDSSWSASSVIDETTETVVPHNIEAATLSNNSHIDKAQSSQSHGTAEAFADQGYGTGEDGMIKDADISDPTSFTEAAIPSITTPMKCSSSTSLAGSAISSSRSPEATRERRKGWSPEKLMSGIATASPLFRDRNYGEPVSVTKDDPYLSPENIPGADLKGLVRAHLRQVSNVSSVSPSPGFQRPMSVFRNMPSIYGAVNSSNSEPEAHRSCDGSSPTPAERHYFSTLKGLASADTRNIIEVQRQHARGGSTESQHERLAFAKELAERQRAIQENLKIKVEHECRSPSPMNNGRTVFEHPFKSFGMLRAMSSRDSVSHKQDAPSKSYKWVDMSAEEFEGPGRGKESADTRVRSTSPPAVGRTLHSRMRETKGSKPGDIRVRKQRQGGIRGGHSERLTPRKEGHRFSTILADSARNSIVAMTSSGRSSVLPLETPQEAGENNISRPRLNHYSSQTSTKGNSTQPQMHPTAHSKAVGGNLASTPRRAFEIAIQSSSIAPGDDDAKDDLSPSKLEPNTPASIAPNSASTHTPSTVSTSTFSTPVLASSNTSFSTPRTTYTASTSSPKQVDHAPTKSPEPPIHSPLPAKPLSYRTPLVELIPKAHNILGRSKATANNTTNVNTAIPTIRKSDISEPTLIASTSTVDTIALPEGASLKNGMGAAGDLDDVFALRAVKMAKEKEALGVGLQGDVPLHVSRKLWEGKENERAQGGEKNGAVVKERKGFLARMGRVGSSEKKENK